MTALMSSSVLCSKLRYYGNFVPMDMTEVQLYGVYDSTNNDSDQHVYTCASISHVIWLQAHVAAAFALCVCGPLAACVTCSSVQKSPRYLCCCLAGL